MGALQMTWSSLELLGYPPSPGTSSHTFAELVPPARVEIHAVPASSGVPLVAARADLKKIVSPTTLPGKPAY